MSTPITLNCYVLGDELGSIFSVHIATTENIDYLRDAIAAKNAATLRHVSPNDLKLWGVSVPLHGDDVSVMSEVPHGSRKLSKPWSRIGTYFTEVQDNYLHVVIERPLPSILTLMCYILGDEPNSIFPVDIATTQSVGHLRDAIKAKDARTLRNVSPNDLKLWAVSFPSGQALITSINDYNFDNEEALEPAKLLSDVFPTFPLQGRVHIAIQTTSPDTLPPLPSIFTARSKWYDGRKGSRLPPSTLGQTQNFRSHQGGDKYYPCCRPPLREPNIPLTLLDPVFAKFIDESQTAVLTVEDYAIARRLRTMMCEFYDDERARAANLRKELQSYKIKLTAAKIGSSDCTTDGHMEINSRPVLILEVKNEIGTGGAEPSIQTMLYYDIFFSEYQTWAEVSSYHPCFVMFLAGPYLGIGGCTLTDRPTLEIFSFVPLNFHHTNDAAYDVLARHLSALRTGVNSLVARYSELPIIGPSQESLSLQHQDHRHVFPYQTTFTSPTGQVKFSYIENKVESSLIFTGQTENKDQIWIKFVRRYGKEVHDWCSQQGFAPKLLGFEALSGGWFMAVLEHLDSTWVPLSDSKTPQDVLRGPIQAAITQLHQEGCMVHGDIRNTNIMVKKTGGSKFMLIDFDWAGRIGEVNYPKFLNPDPSIGRPAAAKDCTPILAEHDDHMFHHLFS